eukprot:1822846-Rhodomonas_salina.1
MVGAGDNVRRGSDNVPLKGLLCDYLLERDGSRLPCYAPTPMCLRLLCAYAVAGTDTMYAPTRGVQY